jgi:putative exosortase-associated protein (TIGR04073 family)
MPRQRFVILTNLIGLVLVLGLYRISSADNFQSFENSSPQEVVEGMSAKAERGLANIATGWLELPKQVYLASKEEGAAKGALIGPLKGIGMTVVRTLAGVGELATFFIAYPGFYDPYFEPGFIWDRE